MIEVAKALQLKFYSVRITFPCPYVVYMYKIMIWLNNLSSETSWPVITKFHVESAVEMGLRFLFCFFQMDCHAHIW